MLDLLIDESFHDEKGSLRRGPFECTVRSSKHLREGEGELYVSTGSGNHATLRS